MMKKTVASLGVAAAASAGVLLLTGSPASAQTTPASARSDLAYVQTSEGAQWRHHGGHHHWRGHHYGYHHGYHHGWNRDGGDIRIVVGDTHISIDG